MEQQRYCFFTLERYTSIWPLVHVTTSEIPWNTLKHRNQHSAVTLK